MSKAYQRRARCAKIAYPSEATAQEALGRLPRRWIYELSDGHSKPVASYECRRCGKWHLTSQRARPTRTRDRVSLAEARSRLALTA